MSKKLLPAYLLTFVNVLGFSILMPILTFVVDSYGAPKWVFGLLLSIYSSFQFIGAPVLGALSDTIGRKKILLVSQGGTLLSWIIFAIALTLPSYHVFGLALPLVIIAISRALDGITGGNVSVTNAYVSDITSREEKSYIFGYLGGIAGLGMIIGPGIGGLTAASPLGYLGTIFTSIFISVCTLIAIVTWLKESHPADDRIDYKRRSLKDVLYIPERIKTVNPAPIIKTIFTVKMIFSSMMGLYIGTMALFLIDLFEFNEYQLGFFMFAVGTFLAFNQAFLSKRFVKYFGEFKTLLIGLLLCAIGMISLTLSRNLVLFLGCYYILNLGLSLCFPTFNALIAIHANPKKQGEIMGISESINSLAMAVFPILAATLYGFIGYKLYYFVSALPFAAFALALIGSKKYGHQPVR